MDFAHCCMVRSMCGERVPPGGLTIMARMSVAKGVALNGEQSIPVDSKWAGFVYHHEQEQVLEVETHLGTFILYPNTSREDFEHVMESESVHKACVALGNRPSSYQAWRREKGELVRVA